MTVKRKPVELHNKKSAVLIQEMGKKAKEQGFINLDFLDQISDNEIIDEPIPFPYGTQTTTNKWLYN